MTDRIDARLIDTINHHQPVRITPAQAGGPIHTRSFFGRWRTARLIGTGGLLLLFFGTAWLNWNGRQAVLWDLAGRKFHIFGAIYWPQDFILLSALLIIAAFGLFFITVLAGRVWCGYACPQSVWTWMFMWAEKVSEGDRSQRIKLDAAPWSLQKLVRRGAKHLLWLAISLATATAFVGYFTPVRELTSDLLSLELGLGAAFWLACFTLATYINAGWLREQICLHMCPYSRFQSVMIDSDTLTVAYDSARGENRGPRRKDSPHREAGLGDCIDCTVCVQVCPTGIDIRDGLQLNCIGCGACADACDSIMDKMGYARGLVRYTSERALAGERTRWLRPRLLGYAGVLLVMIGALIWALAERPLLSLNVTRDRGLYTRTVDGDIENGYSLKIINKAQDSRRLLITLENPGAFHLQGPRALTLQPGEIRDVLLSVSLPASKRLTEVAPLRFKVVDAHDPDNQVQTQSTFLVPQAL